LRLVWVKPDIAKGTSLAHEVPALIQFDLDLREPLTIGLYDRLGGVPSARTIGVPLRQGAEYD